MEKRLKSITTKKAIIIAVGIIAIASVFVLIVNEDNYNYDEIDPIDFLDTYPPVDGDDSPCGPGYYLVGDICDKAPPGYVEMRNQCEIAVDSMEAAGVDQDYNAEYKKCRQP